MVTVPERFILFVGNRRIYKNFKFFIQSISPLMYREKSLQVVCAGGGAFAEDEVNLLKQLGVANRVHNFPIDDGKLSTLYSQAELFVFPSLYEGFGIPMLEALGVGCPVAASRSSSLSEVGGGAARYFDPTDSSSILSTVEEVISDPSLKKTMRARGRERFKDFSWEKTAVETKRVYENLA
jgi:glycosyltransferase involved in cell wall biosynthesis